MSALDGQKKYDLIFIGSGMICVLEAVYQSLSGKSVLMIDQNEDIGGAWLTLDIFGLHEVENAIHYLLPDVYAFEFMKSVLNWDVIPSPKKYRVFRLPLLGYVKQRYDNAFGRLIRKLFDVSFKSIASKSFSNIFLVIKEVLVDGRQPSFYVRGGTPEMLRKLKSILVDSNVETLYRSHINSIHIDNNNKTVAVNVADNTFYAETIYVTHGSRISNLTSASGVYPLEEKIHPRPAVHLLILDDSPSEIYECIFTSDPLIKYVHDVTRFLRESADLVGTKKLLVLALHNDIQNSSEVYRLIVEKLKKSGVIGKKATLQRQLWSDVYLPTIDDQDLAKLSHKFGSQIRTIRTENFTKGIGRNADRWASKIVFQNSICKSAEPSSRPNN